MPKIKLDFSSRSSKELLYDILLTLMTDKSNKNLLIVHSCVYFKECSRLARGTSTGQGGSCWSLFFTGRENEIGCLCFTGRETEVG